LALLQLKTPEHPSETCPHVFAQAVATGWAVQVGPEPHWPSTPPPPQVVPVAQPNPSSVQLMLPVQPSLTMPQVPAQATAAVSAWQMGMVEELTQLP
jgi:hypothetical protein